VFENRMLRRIFGPKRKEVKIGWRKLHNEKIHNLHSLPNIIRVTGSCQNDFTAQLKGNHATSL
jgi:hypothetical protein